MCADTQALGNGLIEVGGRLVEWHAGGLGLYFQPGADFRQTAAAAAQQGIEVLQHARVATDTL
jgi:hypothetical protein